MNLFRYYLIMRPPMPGAQPGGVWNVCDFGEKVLVASINREAWGYVEYKQPLSSDDVKRYELVPSLDNATPACYNGHERE